MVGRWHKGECPCGMACVTGECCVLAGLLLRSRRVGGGEGREAEEELHIEGECGSRR